MTLSPHLLPAMHTLTFAGDDILNGSLLDDGGNDADYTIHINTSYGRIRKETTLVTSALSASIKWPERCLSIGAETHPISEVERTWKWEKKEYELDYADGAWTAKDQSSSSPKTVIGTSAHPAPTSSARTNPLDSFLSATYRLQSLLSPDFLAVLRDS
ncbi:hypothetical protein K523DRAFT_353177 [Schizophyllum commune Tattone D]|nr:hypothetical protein K523DRAFT_353177 [Schizophyllum commune Tattone D]